jgi:hypothetical protein
MNNKELIRINFNGIEKHIFKGKKFIDFKILIKQCFNLTNEEFSRLILSYQNNENIKSFIFSENDYKNYIEYMIYSNKPTMIIVNIKPIVKSFKYDEYGNKIYSLQYYNDLQDYNKEILDIKEQLNNYKKILEEDIKQLKNINENMFKSSSVNISNGLKYKFLNNENEKDYTISIKKSEARNGIKYKFKVENIGKEWPDDTYIKCLENKEIYFKKVGINESKDVYNSNSEFYHEFEVEIFFKKDNNIQIKQYKLKAYLESDKYGRFDYDNKYGNLIINIIDDKTIDNILNDEY